jgi:hypothetical protein
MGECFTSKAAILFSCHSSVLRAQGQSPLPEFVTLFLSVAALIPDPQRLNTPLTTRRNLSTPPNFTTHPGSSSPQRFSAIMARGNQREKSREKNLKAQASQVRPQFYAHRPHYQQRDFAPHIESTPTRHVPYKADSFQKSKNTVRP